MARYILDIPDKVIAHIRADYGHGVKWINEEDRKILVELIYNAKPLGEITPIVRGKWEEQTDKSKMLYGWYFCSNCNAVIGEKTPFCSQCGARMEESEEEK